MKSSDPIEEKDIIECIISSRSILLKYMQYRKILKSHFISSLAMYEYYSYCEFFETNDNPTRSYFLAAGYSGKYKKTILTENYLYFFKKFINRHNNAESYWMIPYYFDFDQYHLLRQSILK